MGRIGGRAMRTEDVAGAGAIPRIDHAGEGPQERTDEAAEKIVEPVVGAETAADGHATTGGDSVSGEDNAGATAPALTVTPRRRGSIAVRFTLLIAAVVLVSFAVYLPWSMARQQAASEGKALAEARVLNKELLAAWDYIDASQDLINYDAAGRYDFKGVFCAVAGKDIARRFMATSDYAIRYVREDPRSATDEPDDFERTALQAFAPSTGRMTVAEAMAARAGGTTSSQNTDPTGQGAPGDVADGETGAATSQAPAVDGAFGAGASGGQEAARSAASDLATTFSAGPAAAPMPAASTTRIAEAHLDGDEYYAIVTDGDGTQALRYVSALRYTGGCIECHGSPAGEKDETGFLREGKRIGDLAGAASVSIPMAVYQEQIRADAVADAGFFLVMMLVAAGIIHQAFTRWVGRPIRRLSRAADALRQGDWGAPVPVDAAAPGEIGVLGADFSAMAQELAASYQGLEEKVAARTAQLAAANDRLEEQSAQLAAANADLGQRTVELDEALGALTRANDRLRDEMAYKSDFYSIVSHELKTPIASVNASLDVWRKGKPGAALDADDEAMAQDVSASTAELLSMVDNLLDMARLEAGRFAPHVAAIDPVDVVAAVEGSVAGIAARKGVRVEVQVDPCVPVVLTDPDVLRKALSNVVGNAVKFSDEDGTVTIRATCGNGGGEARIEVADEGIGIAEEDRERIFESFVQHDSSFSRRYQGSGLGLSLSRRLLEQVGGRIELTSELGVGSTFTLVVPAAPEDDED